MATTSIVHFKQRNFSDSAEAVNVNTLLVLKLFLNAWSERKNMHDSERQ